MLVLLYVDKIFRTLQLHKQLL